MWIGNGIGIGARSPIGALTPYVGLLDTYSGAAAAYSLRQLSSTYTGSAIRVRRSSDNAEQDIGFASNELDTTALTSFCGAGSGFVTTWYDQSGNGNDATQSTAANQPQIVSSGSVILENGIPAIYFNGFTNVINSMSVINQPITIFDVVSIQSYGAVNYMFDSDSTNKIFIGSNASRDWRFFAGIAYNTTTDVELSQTLLTGLFDGSGSELFINSVSAGSGNVGSNGISQLFIGTKNDSTIGIIGNCQEFFIYPSDQSSNRTGIETNINDFYSIY